MLPKTVKLTHNTNALRHYGLEGVTEEVNKNDDAFSNKCCHREVIFELMIYGFIRIHCNYITPITGLRPTLMCSDSSLLGAHEQRRRNTDLPLPRSKPAFAGLSSVECNF